MNFGSAGNAQSVNRGVVLDVPVDAAFQFDYYVDMVPFALGASLTIKQLGVWI
jgi:hypothetical protein